MMSFRLRRRSVVKLRFVLQKAEDRDASIHKRFSWNYGPQSCAKRQMYVTQDDNSGQGHQDVMLIDRATSPLGPPAHSITGERHTDHWATLRCAQLQSLKQEDLRNHFKVSNYVADHTDPDLQSATQLPCPSLSSPISRPHSFPVQEGLFTCDMKPTVCFCRRRLEPRPRRLD